MNRRAGGVSGDDEEFFRQALRDARPLKKRRVDISPARFRHGAFEAFSAHRSPPRSVGSDPAVPQISGHAESRLRRGRMEPESRIDLHGQSYESAYRSLVSFLTRGYADGKRLVLVITGKGSVLRPHLALWLNSPELQQFVIGIREAHPKHGGSGAFYVALQRRRPMRPQA